MHEELPRFELVQALSVLSEELHFGVAADELDISQPALSRRLQALEKQVGVTLVDRSTRDLILTPAGRAFLEEAERAQGSMTEALRRAQAVDAGVEGQLSIGLLPSAAIEVVPKLVRSFLEVRPAVTVSLHEHHESAQWNFLENGELDLICVRSLEREGYAQRVIIDAEPICFLTYTDHPLARRKSLTIAEIVDEQFVSWPGSHKTRIGVQELQRFADHDATMKIVHESTSLWGVLGLVSSGLGCALLAGSYSKLTWPGIVYVPVRDYSYPLYMCWSDDNANPALASFLQATE